MDCRPTGGRRRKRTAPAVTRKPETRSRGGNRSRGTQARNCRRSRPPVIDIPEISIEDEQPPPACGISRSRSPCSHTGTRRSVTKSRSRSPRRRSAAQDSGSYCCCGSCQCSSPNRRSVPARIEPRDERSRSRSRSQCRRDRLHPVITANGDVEIRAATGNNDDEDGVVLIHKTTNGSVIVRGLKDGCGDATIGGRPIPAKQLAQGVEFHFQNAAAATARSCCAFRDQGTDPLEDSPCGVSQISPQKSLDLLGGVEVRFDHHTFPLSPRPQITELSGTDSYDSDIRFCAAPPPSARPQNACEPVCKPTRQRSPSRSRSRERKRNRPPDPETTTDRDTCHNAQPTLCAGLARTVCEQNCRSPWSPSLTCTCMCHDPDRDVAWVSWPIFGPRIAAWIQDHRRCIVNRMRAEQTRRLQCHMREQ